jgi:multidrug efflux pump subunit AcrB
MHRLVPLYTVALKAALRLRYLAVAIATAVLVISGAVIASGHLPFTFLPSSDAETVVVEMRMPVGTPLGKTDRMAQRLERAAQARAEVETVTTMVGTRSDVETGQSETTASHLAQMFIELVSIEQRDRTSAEVIDAIRGALQDQMSRIDRLNFREMSGGPGGPDISVEIRGPETQALRQAAADLKQQLARFEGVFEISDDEDRGQLELQVRPKPNAAALGFTQENIATQLRGYLFGLEAHTFAADEEDIDVRVRADAPMRHNLARVEHAWLVSPAGRPVPVKEVAAITQTSGYATIKRIDGQRAITVTADTVAGLSPESIVPQLELDRIRQAHPSVTMRYGGRQERQAEAFASLPWGMLAALAMVYVILAWLFNSYLQPFTVMLVIPFALIGVTWGHWLLGFDLTFLSVIGFVALTGIVVNDSLILVSFYNMQRAADWSVYESLIHAGRARLRPILLTTITTVLGLTPLMLEQSFQARFLIPMAIAVAFGLLSATVLILLVLPCFLLIFEDLKEAAHWLWFGAPRGDP